MTDDLVKRLNETLGSISSPPVFYGDNLAIVLCAAFEDDGEQNENGWTDAAIEGCETTLQAIRGHYAPLADRIEALTAELTLAEQRGYSNAMEAERKLHEDRIDELEVSLQAVLNREAATTARYDAKTDELEDKLAKATEALRAVAQHEASIFFGLDAEKNRRASWRGVMRKVKAALSEIEGEKT
jgi:chromosome segregation ATPase